MSEKNESRDWELTCEGCDGDGFVYVERRVGPCQTDIQTFKEECECCEGRGFTIAFEDIPGIEAYVKSCRPTPASAQPESMREGYPHDDPQFIALCREHDILGTAMQGLAAVFWRAASAQDDAKDWRDQVMEIITGVWDREIQIDHATDEIIDLLSPAAPAAGDALAALRELVECDSLKKRIASMQVCVLETEDDVQELDAMMSDLARRQPAAWDAARAALAAQVPQQGEA